jgi:hypothetical protein
MVFNMKYLLFLMSLPCFLAFIMNILNGAIQQAVGGIWLIVGAVFLSSSAIVNAINGLHLGQNKQINKELSDNRQIRVRVPKNEMGEE